MSEPWRHEFVRANGIRFRVATAGEGPLLLLLHGFPQYSYAWRHQIAALAERFRVVAPDLRGYGETDKPPRVADYAPATLARDVVELVDALGENRAHVVGHDWGGAIAWVVALRHPEVVDRLAVLNCPHPFAFARALRTNPRQLARSWYVFAFQIPRLPEWALTRRNASIVEPIFREMAKRPDTFSDEDLERYRAALLAPGAAAAAVNYYRAAFRGALELRAEEKADAKIAAPTLVVWAEEDVALGKELTFGMERHFRGPFRIEYVPGCSHWVNEEQPELVNRLLLEHLGGPA